MESVEELRKLLQEPRREVDTWYGKTVMRLFSIYSTRYFIERKWTPNQVTLLSVVLAFWSGVFFFFGFFALGILFINLWYLIDHSDGEVARYTKQSSATGFFFDTVVNFFVQPWMFFSIGLGLERWGYAGASALGILAAFASLMLIIMPMCEDSVLLHLFRKKGTIPAQSVKPAATEASPEDLLKQCFAIWHKTVLFPNVLLFITGFYIFLRLFRMNYPLWFCYIWFYFGVSMASIAVLQLVRKVQTKKLDGEL